MDISFSERLSNIMAMQTLLSLPASTGHLDAKELEQSAHQQARSKDEYHELCSRIIKNLHVNPTQPADPSDADVEMDVRLDSNGATMGSYKHLTFHRDGQMSIIYRAEPVKVADGTSANVDVAALKVTHPSSMAAPHNSEKEARILDESRHGSIIPLLDTFWQAGGQFVLVFPFLTYDFETLLRQDALTKAQNLEVIRILFDALAHLHGLGIIHRDVKPSNILLRSRDGPAYLADFGIAWSPHDSDSEPPESKITDVGTTSYRPPELLFGYRAYDTSLDIWAAGCVFAEAVRPSHEPLFNAGELGSELALIKSMFSTLGTPNDAIWPSAKKYPDWGKMRFHEYPQKDWTEILPGVATELVDFIRQTVCYESTQRLTADEALERVALLRA